MHLIWDRCYSLKEIYREVHSRINEKSLNEKSLVQRSTSSTNLKYFKKFILILYVTCFCLWSQIYSMCILRSSRCFKFNKEVTLTGMLRWKNSIYSITSYGSSPQNLCSSVRVPSVPKNGRFEKLIASGLLYRYTIYIVHFKGNRSKFYSVERVLKIGPILAQEQSDTELCIFYDLLKRFFIIWRDSSPNYCD